MKVTARLVVCLSVLLLTVFPAAVFGNTIALNEIICQIGTSVCPGAQSVDPVVNVTETGLTQNLGFLAAAGDVVLSELGGIGGTSDVLHFNGPVGGFGNSLFLFSDPEPGEVDPTDVPVPPGFVPSSNAVFGNEGPLPGGGDGALYIVLNPDGSVNAQYNIQSDPVPEPASLLLLGTGLVGLLGYGWRQRKKTA